MAICLCKHERAIDITIKSTTLQTSNKKVQQYNIILQDRLF